MLTLSASGQIKRIFPTVTRKSPKSGKTYSTRKFWVMTSGDDFGGTGKGQIAEFSIFSIDDCVNPNIARAEDLDKIAVGKVVRFNFRIMSVLSVNKKTGHEVCYTNLSVCSRLEVLDSRTKYHRNNEKAIAGRKEAEAKNVEAAVKMVSGDNPAAPAPF